MPEPVRYRLAVCKGTDCRMRGADAVFRAAGEAVRAGELQRRCEVARGGCYGQCNFGPNVVIREVVPGRPYDPFSAEDYQLLGTPDETYYPAMDVEKILRVIREHIAEGRRVEELVHRPK